MKKILFDGNSIENYDDLVDAYGKTAAVFDTYHMKRSKKKIFVGKLYNANIVGHIVKHQLAGGNGEIEKVVNTFCFLMEPSNHYRPAIYYMNRKFIKAGSDNDRYSFHIACRDGKRSKFSFTASEEEFDCEVRKIASKENKALEKFMRYVKELW